MLKGLIHNPYVIFGGRDKYVVSAEDTEPYKCFYKIRDAKGAFALLLVKQPLEGYAIELLIEPDLYYLRGFKTYSDIECEFYEVTLEKL